MSRSSATTQALKRLRTEEVAKKAGLTAYETEEGRRWLWKALNPNDTATASVGIPADKTHNISALNYQSQYDIVAPPGVSAAFPSYDVDLYLNHNPVVFGTSVAYSSGTMDLSQVGGFQVKIGAKTAADTYEVTLIPDDAPAKPVGLRTVQQLFNSQIDPRVFAYSSSLASRRLLYSQLTQKAKLTYGGALVIPTCSDLNNGGLITACQQVCEPKVSMVDSANGIYLNSYETTDFPDVEDTIQNPQMYSARFIDGCYMPYKMRDPFNMEYKSSEREITNRAPYSVTGVSVMSVQGLTDGLSLAKKTEATHFYTLQTPMVFTPNTADTGFTLKATVPDPVDADGQLEKNPVLGFRFDVVNYLGQRGYFYVSLNDEYSIGNNKESGTIAGSASKLITTDPIVRSGRATYNIYNGLMEEASSNELAAGFAIDNWWTFVTLANNNYIYIPEIITAWDTQGTGYTQNPLGLQWVSTDVTSGAATNTALSRGTMPDMLEFQMCTVHMTGCSSTAPIKLILKVGIEILLNAGSPYSPFKFISPKYDESALKSYLRCTRAMRDAYFANAGGMGGQAEFIKALSDLIESDSAAPLSRVLNQGGNYISLIG